MFIIILDAEDIFVEMKVNNQKSSNFKKERSAASIKMIYRKLLLHSICNINSIIHEL